MPRWLLFTILCFLSYTLSSAFDKYLVNHRYNIVRTDTLKMLLDAVVLLVVGVFFFDLQLSNELFMLALLPGALTAIGGILYFEALQKKDIEVIFPYLQAVGILLIFAASIFLFREPVSAINILGVFVICLGIFVLLSRHGFHLPKPDGIFSLAVGIALCDLLYALAVKQVLGEYAPINLAILVYLASTLFLFLYQLLLQNKSPSEILSFRGSTPKVFFSSIFGSLGTLFLFTALSLGNASRIFPLAAMESVFIFIIATLVLKERFTPRRFASVLVIAVGIYFVLV
jgi:drug/metabolite transporter (DMT)-like permease